MGIQMHTLSTTLETPYNLTYGTDAMIPNEIGEPSLRKQLFDLSMNNESLTMNLDWLKKFKDKAHIRDEAYKIGASKRYNSKVKPRKFYQVDLVWRMRSKARKTKGKLLAN